MSATPPSIPAELAQAYAETLFIIETGVRQRITCEVGKTPPSPLPADTVAVITAWNPGLGRPTERDNRAANQRLERAVEELGYAYLPAAGRSRDGAHEEPSIAVLDISRPGAISVGRRFGQAAIFWVDNRSGELLWC